MHTDLYRQMFENDHTILLVLDSMTGAIVDANPGAVQYYGYPRDVLRGMTFTTLNPALGIALRRWLNDALAGKIVQQPMHHQRADGERRDVLMTITPLNDPDQTNPLLYAVVQDITAQLLTEQALRDSEARYRLLAEAMHQGVTVQDADARLIYVNETFCEMIGYDRHDLIGKSLMTLLPEESRETMRQQLRQRYRGESASFELMLHHKSGDPRYVIIASTAIMGAQRVYRGSFAVITDITTTKTTEQALLKSNAELDAFTRTVAHDLKNPLSVLMGFSSLLEREHDVMTPEELRDALRTVGDTASKMVGIIDDLLLLSQMRHKSVRLMPLDMPQIISEAMNRLGYLRVMYDAEIVQPERFPLALGYAPWVEAVWTNYISNAIKYGGIPPRVELSAHLLEDGRISFNVTDNGKGIAPDKVSRLFLPFERLEEARAEGHGIGLSIVQRIMNRLNGEVRVNSVVGKGSTFSFILPPAPVEVGV